MTENLDPANVFPPVRCPCGALPRNECYGNCTTFLRRPDEANSVDHPAHYGGAGDPYEAIKVIEAWSLGFNLGNVVKYISRADRKTDNPIEDLKKAAWYLQREIANLETAHG